MATLLLDIDSSALFRNSNTERADDDPVLAPLPMPSPSPPRVQLPSADIIVQKLQALALSIKESEDRISNAHADQNFQVNDMQDDASMSSFDSPSFVAIASRALGSYEKLQAVRKFMGRLSPRSNQRFIGKLQIGTTSKLVPVKSRETALANESFKIKPPYLPKVNSSEWIKQCEILFPNLAVSVERTAAPAMLRRRVKRLERGYRAADVLRARMQGANLADTATPPNLYRRGDKTQRRPWMRGRKLDLNRDDEISGRDNSAQRRRSEDGPRIEENQQKGTDNDDEISSEGTPPKKRKLRSELSDDKQSSVDDSLSARNPLAMLVEAAAEQQKQSSAQIHAEQHEVDGEESTGNARGQSSAEHSRKRRKIVRRKSPASK